MTRVRLLLSCAVLVLSLILTGAADAGELSGVVVDVQGNPIRWVKERILVDAMGRQETILVPDVQIEVFAARFVNGMLVAERSLGKSNSERDGTFTVTWDDTDAMGNHTHFLFRFNRIAGNAADPEQRQKSSFKLKLDRDTGELDPADPNHGKEIRQYVPRHDDVDRPRSTPSGPKKKGGKNS